MHEGVFILLFVLVISTILFLILWFSLEPSDSGKKHHSAGQLEQQNDGKSYMLPSYSPSSVAMYQPDSCNQVAEDLTESSEETLETRDSSTDCSPYMGTRTTVSSSYCSTGYDNRETTDSSSTMSRRTNSASSSNSSTERPGVADETDETRTYPKTAGRSTDSSTKTNSLAETATTDETRDSSIKETKSSLAESSSSSRIDKLATQTTESSRASTVSAVSTGESTKSHPSNVSAVTTDRSTKSQPSKVSAVSTGGSTKPQPSNVSAVSTGGSTKPQPSTVSAVSAQLNDASATTNANHPSLDTIFSQPSTHIGAAVNLDDFLIIGSPRKIEDEELWRQNFNGGLSGKSTRQESIEPICRQEEAKTGESRAKPVTQLPLQPEQQKHHFYLKQGEKTQAHHLTGLANEPIVGLLEWREGLLVAGKGKLIHLPEGLPAKSFVFQTGAELSSLALMKPTNHREVLYGIVNGAICVLKPKSDGICYAGMIESFGRNWEKILATRDGKTLLTISKNGTGVWRFKDDQLQRCETISGTSFSMGESSYQSASDDFSALIDGKLITGNTGQRVFPGTKGIYFY